MKEIYLDNSATTRVFPEAAEEATKVMTEYYGNPSSLHKKGIEAEQIMEGAREEISSAIGGKLGHLYFTSGGTESNNLAILGTAYAKKRTGNRIILSAYEHDSIMECGKVLLNEGYDVQYIYPSEDGTIKAESVCAIINEKTTLVSIMLVNNETGAVNDIKSIVSAVKKKNANIICHTDAVQAFGKYRFSAKDLGVDLMTVTAHKIGGPKGVGALWIKKDVRVVPIHFGGEQEKRIRPGTQAMPLIAAFGKAAKLTMDGQTDFIEKMNLLKEKFLLEIKDIPEIKVNSKEPSVGAIVNISVLGIRSEIMLHYLEEKGIYVSSGSACSMGARSHVLASMGYPSERVDSALRISFGRDTEPEDIDILVSSIKEATIKLCK